MKKSLISIFLIIATIVVAWKINFPSGTWRYKITVALETPEGIKSGSAVREVRFRPQTLRFHDGGCAPAVRGEAVVVDLGPRGKLFSTINWNSYEEMEHAFGLPITGCGEDRVQAYDSVKLGQRADMKDKYYPQMVMFENIADPKSVKLVYGAKFDAQKQESVRVNDFESVFGAGVKIKVIRIEMTDEAETKNIKEILPWLDSIKGGYLDGQFAGGGPELSNILHYGNFKIGEN